MHSGKLKSEPRINLAQFLSAHRQVEDDNYNQFREKNLKFYTRSDPY
jgi:hypothetical protein